MPLRDHWWCILVAIFGAFLITIFGAYSITDYSLMDILFFTIGFIGEIYTLYQKGIAAPILLKKNIVI